MREFEIILLQTQFSFIKNTLKRFAKSLRLNFTFNHIEGKITQI